MAAAIDHIAQAWHNRDCATRFLRDCRDWAITAIFYAAIHFVEAGLTAKPEGHSDSTTPDDISPHKHRENLIRQYFSPRCFHAYRKLDEASRNSRYLLKPDPGNALTYYSDRDARAFLTNLDTIRQEVQSGSGVNLDR